MAGTKLRGSTQLQPASVTGVEIALGSLPFGINAGEDNEREWPMHSPDANLPNGPLYERGRVVASGEWASYVPTWTAVTGSNTLGNGTLTGRKMVIGKTQFFQISLVFGSTTTGSADAWLFSLPAVANNPARLATGLVYALDSGVADYIGDSITYQFPSATDVYAKVAAGTVTSAVPFTWATADSLTINGYYDLP